MLPSPAQVALGLLVLAGSAYAQSESSTSSRLLAALKGDFSFASLPSDTPAVEVTDDYAEPILHLETMKVTASPGFHLDLLEAAKRANDAREAAQFSLLAGGQLWSKRLGWAEVDLGVWTFWAPRTVDALHAQGPMLWAQVCRLKW
jgi:hypothetical protein